MKPLTLEIHGTGTHNRGAELMAIAIGERMRSSFPEVRFVVARGFGEAEARKRHVFLTDANLLGGLEYRLAGAVLRNVGPAIRSSLGFVHPREIDVVLDASGFSYSDQWGPRQAEFLVAKMETPDRTGTPLILLPQALGPFEDSGVARASRALFERAALICARDEQSHSVAAPLVDPSKLRRYPDFTVGVEPRQPTELELPDSFSAIVPNYRMLDKTGEGDEYLSFLGAAIERLGSAGMNPLVVLHDAADDRKVIERVRTNRRIDVIEHRDPRVLKGILGRADLVVGSRFHGLVSSLSQGVPCIGAGWSHKYPELFKDFGVPELVMADLTDRGRLDEILSDMETPEGRGRYRERILSAGHVLKRKSEEMWQEVEGLIRERVPSAAS
jgi:colanic acid/amylovoran biosynthesis protein